MINRDAAHEVTHLLSISRRWVSFWSFEQTDHELTHFRMEDGSESSSFTINEDTALELTHLLST